MTLPLPSYVKIGQVSGTSLVVGVDTLNDIDTAPDAAFPVGSIFTFDPSIPYLRFTATHYTAYLQSVKGVVRADGTIGTPDGNDLYLVANIGQDDDEAGQRSWYWTVSPAIAGMGVLPPFKLDVTADGIAYLTDAQPVPVSPTLSALKGDKGDPGTPGINVPPAGTPDGYIACSVGDAVSWRDPASLGLVGTSLAVDNTAGTATLTEGTTSAVVYQKTEADTLLGQKVATSSLGAASGVATLGSDGKLTAAQSPVSLVDNGDGTFTVSVDGGVSETTYTKAELDTKFGTSGGTLTDAGVKTADYTMGPGELVRTDNSTNSLTVTLPVATVGRRQLVRNIALTAPNTTTVYAGDSQAFDDGRTSVVLDEVGMILDVEALAGGVWAVRGLNLSEAGQDAKYDPINAAQTVNDNLTAQIQSVQRQIVSPTITAQIRHDGAVAVGPFEAPGLWIEQGFTAQCARLYAGTAPASAALVVEAKVAGVLVHTITLPVGDVSTVDLTPTDARTSTTGLDFTDGETLVDLEVTQGDASNILLVYSSVAGAAPAPTIGTVGALSLTPQPGGFTATASYTASGDNDLLDHYSLRWTTGSTAPQTLSDGTAGPDVDGSTPSPTFQVSGCPYGTDLLVSVFAVGANGAVSTPASGLVHTQVQNPTAPLPGTLSLVGGTKTVNGCLLLYTADSSNTDVEGIWLRESRGTATPPPTPSSGRPANSGTSIPVNTGTGLWVPLDAGSNSVTVTIDDFAGATSSNFAFSAFPQNTSGVVNTSTPTTNGVHVFTPSAAPSTGQGLYGLIPSTATLTLDFEPANYSTATLGNIFAMDQGWAHESQGPSARSNWAIIADPITSGRQILRLTGQTINDGWYNSSYSKFDSTWTQGVANGTGDYGSRGNVKNQNKLYGAFEIKCRTAAPYATGWKNGNVMRWPLTGWPQGEGDDREGWTHLGNGINEHYYPGGTKSAGTQVSVSVPIDESIDQTVTCLYEKPVGSDPARIRVWYTQAGVDLGSGVGVSHCYFDTGKPSAGIGPTPSTMTQAKVDYILANPQQWYLGFALAYASGDFTTGRAAQYFDIISLQMWDVA